MPPNKKGKARPKKMSAEEKRREAARKRFSEPVVVNMENLTPQQRERLELQNEAFRRAIYLNDYSLGRQLGLFPPLEDENPTADT